MHLVFRGKEIEKNLNDIDESLIYMNETKKMSFVDWAASKPSIKFVEPYDHYDDDDDDDGNDILKTVNKNK